MPTGLIGQAIITSHLGNCNSLLIDFPVSNLHLLFPIKTTSRVMLSKCQLIWHFSSFLLTPNECQSFKIFYKVLQDLAPNTLFPCYLPATAVLNVIVTSPKVSSNPCERIHFKTDLYKYKMNLSNILFSSLINMGNSKMYNLFKGGKYGA